MSIMDSMYKIGEKIESKKTSTKAYLLENYVVDFFD